MAVADAAGFPLALYVASASPHEVTLVEDTLERIFTNELPRRLIGDKAYDSDKLDAKLEEDCAIEPLIGHLKNDFRLVRNYLKGTVGDAVNLLLSAAAFNCRKWMRAVAQMLFFVLFTFQTFCRHRKAPQLETA